MDSLRISENSLMDSPSGPTKRKLGDRQPPGQSLVSSNASHTPEGPRSNFDQIHESPAMCASPRHITNAMGTKKMRENEKAGNDFHEQLDLRVIAGGNVDEISAKMDSLTTASLEKMVKELKVILEGNDDSQKLEYLMLQKLVQSRADLNTTTLSGAHRSQLEILVAIITGSHAFFQPRTSLSLSKTSLIDIFLQKICRNLECQILLPAKNCACMTCTNKKGFCNICMCVICNNYEFKVDSFPLSCDMCSHKIHLDCAMRNGLIGKSKAGSSRMVFRCQDCSKLIDLMIKSFDKAWDRGALIRDFDLFSRILHGSDNPRQRELLKKFEDLKEKMKNDTMLSPTTGREIFEFLEELSTDAPKSVENGEGGKLIAPPEASNQIVEVEMKMKRDMPCPIEVTLISEEEEEEQEQEEEEEEHATPETEVIEEEEEEHATPETEVEAPNNPDGVRVEEVQPLEQLQRPVDADGAQPEPATRDACPSSPNSSSNLRSSTLLRKFPPIPSNLPGPSFSNMEIPDLTFNGTYSSSKDTTGATTPEQQQIIADFFRTHPTVQTRIESYSKVLQNTFFEHLATLLHHLQYVRVRDFDEAKRAKVEVAWNDLTNAGCELQDLKPAVNRALHEKIREREAELAKTMLILQKEIQACQDMLDKPPLYNSDDH